MNIIEKVTAAIAGYFEQLRTARIEFWAQPSTDIGPASFNGVVTAIAFVLARSRFIHLPSPSEYGKVLIVYVAVVCLVGGIACLTIPRTAGQIGSNIRRFLTTTGVTSTIGAAIIAIFPGIAAPIAAWWSDNISFGDPDVIPTAFAAALIGVLAIVLIGRGQTPVEPLPSSKDWTVALTALFLANFLGLWVVIGLGRFTN
ncbi:MAG TPA: hypothetical protein VN838_21345 [Bradyrhizobium sp.]|nr:hypothetical protein [Bradyrhizobium sp.]